LPELDKFEGERPGIYASKLRLCIISVLKVLGTVNGEVPRSQSCGIGGLCWSVRWYLGDVFVPLFSWTSYLSFGGNASWS